MFRSLFSKKEFDYFAKTALPNQAGFAIWTDSEVLRQV
jgi:hypothetical protein